MNKTFTNSEIEYIISRVLDNANDALNEQNDTDFNKGKKMAYYEVLDTIKNELLLHDHDVSKFGLDIDLDKRL